MADEPLSPLPFRRERNLSNRNFHKRNSRRSSTQSVQLERHSCAADVESGERRDSSSSSHIQSAYMADISATDWKSNQLSSAVKMHSPSHESEETDDISTSATTPIIPPGTPGTPDTPGTPTADPALLDVRQKVQRFETLKTRVNYTRQERLSLKLLENRHHPSFSQYDVSFRNRTVPHELILAPGLNSSNSSSSLSAITPVSIDEVRSEDEVDQISDYETNNTDPLTSVDHTVGDSASAVLPASDAITDEEKVTAQHVQRSISADPSELVASLKMRNDKQFPRNYRSTPRRKTEIIGITNQRLVDKFHSVYQPKEEEEEVEIELRDKSDKCVHPILEELIHTEEAYVKSLFTGLENYGNIFQRKDLPVGLRGKKYDLFGNIEQIAEFHRDEFLPMLHRNRRDLKRLFDEFMAFLDENCFYGYVIFTMNKQKSLKLCDTYKNYFTSIRLERDDKLGINSFLVQPIQRMARYPLLLTQFITTFFKNRDIVMKPLIESCCRLEKRLRTLLTTTNESEIINDIVDCNEFNVYYQGKFRKVSEFQVTDYKLKRSYRAKVFIFDKCIIYTEVKGKQLVFHGRYPCEHVGISAKTKSFTLYYERRKQQECDFVADAAQITLWLDLIRDMISNYANEERQKLQERYCRETDHLHRKAPSFSLYRDSNRFSSDSGIGNIWIMPKPDEDTVSNRTTWYAST